jgi:SAM-dependent methyltransferase
MKIPLLQRILKAVAKEEVKAYIKKEIAAVQVPSQDQLNDLSILTQQLLWILRQEANIPPPPPKHLQIRVVGGYLPHFIESGYTHLFQLLNQGIKLTGKELKDFKSILDWGCGCGRGIRAFATMLPSCKFYGTHIDPEAIKWLKANYSKFGEFSIAPHLPPLPYEDQKFDLVFGFSVFTHLPEDMQFEWLKELTRITKPHGYAILSTHGENFYKTLSAEIREVINKKGFFHTDFGKNYGRSISLPDFYQTAYHSTDYIRKEWSKYFDVIDIKETPNNHDIILLQNRG